MTDKILEMIKQVEFSNNSSKLLHKNPTEDGLTYFGIYETAHPDWYGWNIIKRYLVNTPDLKECSEILANVSDLNYQVKQFYKKEFFDKMKLGQVNNEDKQLEVMCLAINIGIRPAVKVLQKVLNVEVDGIIGKQTIDALNNFNDDLFDKLFDEAEIKYYDSLIENKPKFEIYRKGWHNRANLI